MHWRMFLWKKSEKIGAFSTILWRYSFAALHFQYLNFNFRSSFCGGTTQKENIQIYLRYHNFYIRMVFAFCTRFSVFFSIVVSKFLLIIISRFETMFAKDLIKSFRLVKIITNDFFSIKVIFEWMATLSVNNVSANKFIHLQMIKNSTV